MAVTEVAVDPRHLLVDAGGALFIALRAGGNVGRRGQRMADGVTGFVRRIVRAFRCGSCALPPVGLPGVEQPVRQGVQGPRLVRRRGERAKCQCSVCCVADLAPPVSSAAGDRSTCEPDPGRQGRIQLRAAGDE